MIGFGGEGTHHPTCKLPKGHDGACSEVALAAREEPQDLGEPDAALVWRAARAMWEAGPTTSRRGWEDLSDRQREFAYNEARAAVGVVFVAVREADYDPDRDKRPYSELSETQRIARERASLKRQLDAVDRELKWAGTGRGRIQSIRLLSAREDTGRPDNTSLIEMLREEDRPLTHKAADALEGLAEQSTVRDLNLGVDVVLPDA